MTRPGDPREWRDRPGCVWLLLAALVVGLIWGIDLVMRGF